MQGENYLTGKQKAVHVISTCLNFPNMKEWNDITSLFRANLNSMWKPEQIRCLIHFILLIINNSETT